MSAEGEAPADGGIMKIDEKHKQMNRTKSVEWISVSVSGASRWGGCDDDDDGLPW